MKSNSTIYNRKDIVKMGRIVSEKLNIPLNVVLMAYNLFYEKIATDISSMNLREDEVQNNLDDLTLSFNIKHLGKFYSTKEIINKINENIRNKRERLNEDIKCENGNSN